MYKYGIINQHSKVEAYLGAISQAGCCKLYVEALDMQVISFFGSFSDGKSAKLLRTFWEMIRFLGYESAKLPLIDFRQGCGRSVCENKFILHHIHYASLWQTKTSKVMTRVKLFCTSSPVSHCKVFVFCCSAWLFVMFKCLLLSWVAGGCPIMLQRHLGFQWKPNKKHLCSFVFGIQRNTVVLFAT